MVGEILDALSSHELHDIRDFLEEPNQFGPLLLEDGQLFQVFFEHLDEFIVANLVQLQVWSTV